MRSIILSGAVAAALALAAAANATDYCNDLPDAEVPNTLYVFVDCDPLHACTHDAFGVWVYVESNGEPGAQRGGLCVLCNPPPDTCQNSTNPDVLLI